jgi:sec-independent protein translocase protein TatC
MPTDPVLVAEERSMVAMSLGDHIEDLRHHLIRALSGLFVGIVLTVVPPLNLGRMVVQRLQEPAQRTLVAFHAEQLMGRAAAADLAGSYTPIATRIPASAFARAVREVFPDLPASRAGALDGRYVELPQELKDSDMISAVSPYVERGDSLIALGPMEPALIFFKVCLVTGIVLSSPWSFYQVWAFVAAGLYRRERMFVYRFLPSSLGVCLAGVSL